jgi:hypothetical protein
LISTWLEEIMPEVFTPAAGASPYSTGGGGVRLEHSYAACLIAGLLAGEAVSELGDSLSVDSIRLQASDVSAVDDILIEGRDTHGVTYRSSIGVRRNPSLTTSDSASVPLIRDFLTLVTEQWPKVSAGQWRLVLAVSTNANAITQLSDLAALAHTLPSGEALEDRLPQPRRTNTGVRGRYDHVKSLIEQASDGLASAEGLEATELTWRFLSNLTVRSLRLEGTDRTDRTVAVNTLQRVLHKGTPASADALFSRVEELVGTWAQEAAILTQSVIRRRLSDYPLSSSPRFANAWAVIDRLGASLRDLIRPALRAGTQTLELERPAERSRLDRAMRSVGDPPGVLVVTGDPDVGKSALALRVAEMLQRNGAAVSSLSLRDLPQTALEFENQLGGFAIEEVLAAGVTRPVRLLLIDGAESVLEGKSPVLQAVAAAALKAGIGVVAVTRTDGSRQVQSVLANACELAGISAAPAEHVVGPLTQDECQQLGASFPTLARLRGDSRVRWLLGRPGLVDVLLRTGESLDPADFLCEADVFSTVWRSTIRGQELRATGTASPDDREYAVLSVAKRSLRLPAQPVHGTASAELRSAGVLRVPNNPAFSVGDEFSTDLFRDFALCRLFLVEGWETLSSASAPRWSIRATRLGCQAALLMEDTSSAWAALSTQFADIAYSYGERWLEIPFEALLTLGDAESAIRELWETLTAEDGSSLATLLRLAEARYVDGTVGDAFALAPLIKVAFCEKPTIDRGPQLGHRTIREVIRDIVLAWLRGMATSRPQPDGLRQAVRDVILAGDPPLHDGFSIEALATLGPDLDDRAEAWLRQVARDRPDNLNPAVESLVVAPSMSQHRSQLLLDLAEAYYIELPDSRRTRWGGGRLRDNGIRDFKHGLGLRGSSSGAAWYYGPFFRLLNIRPVETIDFINRMLDHAARLRVDKASSFQSDPTESADHAGIEMEIPNVGVRRYVGDGDVWSWYRATSTGPYPCMSALLALERFIDHLLEKGKIPANAIVDLLLRGCHNLAVPGLLVGFLTRHPNEVGDLLDPFLVHPEVWHLETSRVTSEYFKFRGRDADDSTGSEHRSQTTQQTVATMVVNARFRGDDRRLAKLAEVGGQLVENAKAKISGSVGENEYIAMVEGWAAQFQPDNYRASQTSDGIVIEFERPPQIEQVLARENRELQTVNTLYGLQNRYGRYNDSPEKWPHEHLDEDLAIARQIDDQGSATQSFHGPGNSLVAVAAAAVRAHALGLVALNRSDLSWASNAVIRAAENPPVDERSDSGSMFTMGADRAAAAAAPLLLLAPYDDLGLDRSRIEGALRALAASTFDEVRAIYAKGCEPLWLASCDIDDTTNHCRRHEPAWAAAMLGLTDCRLGPRNQETRRREPDSLPVPFHESLPTVVDDKLLVNRLRAPLVTMVDARRVQCLQGAVAELWEPLWDAHRRGLFHWWKEGYDHLEHITHEPIARRMVTIALDGDREHIKAHIESFSESANALHLLFDGFATVFTYDDELRKSMDGFWSWAMEIALDSVGSKDRVRSEDHWFDYMAAALLPTPNPHSWDPDIDGTFAHCRKNWIQPSALEGIADRWLQLARWEAKAVDAIIKFGKSAPRKWQTTVALTWIETVIDNRFDQIANRLYYLEDWLTELRNAGLITGEVMNQCHRIVDGLATAGDRSAVRLQKLDE